MSASGVQSFIVRKRIAGKPSNITLGRYGPRFGLAEARKKARAVLSDIEAGGDPSSPHAASKRAQPGAETIRGLLPAYLAAKAERRSVGEMKRVMENYVLPELGDRLADAVTRADVTRLIDKVAATAPVMARNVHAQLSAFYSWAMPRLDRLPSNPCRDAGRPSAPKARDRVLSDEELVCLWRLVEAEPFPWNIALKLLILTGQRRNEVFEADWAEFDLKKKVWTIPGERAKNGERHEVPLTTSVLALATFVVRTGRPLPKARVPMAQLVGTFGYEAAIRLRRRGGGEVVELVAAGHPPEKVELEPGDALVFLGSTRHAGGANRSDAARRGVVVGYAASWLVPAENPALAYPPEVARTFAPELAALVGYRRYAPNLNNYDCRCPSELLAAHGPGVGAVDELVPEHVAGLERFYGELAA